MKNYYEELEVSKNASDEIINRAYKVLAKKYHPDTTTIEKKIAEERFKKISEAYEVLSNKQKKAEYDKTLVPDINIDKYNQILEHNKILSKRLLKIKAELDSINLNKQNYNNINSTRQYNGINNTNNSYTNVNPNYQNNYRQTYTYTRQQNTQKYSFKDIIKYKIDEFCKNGISLLLTIGIVIIALSVLYLLPPTRNFLINDLHLGILFRIFK